MPKHRFWITTNELESRVFDPERKHSVSLARLTMNPLRVEKGMQTGLGVLDMADPEDVKMTFRRSEVRPNELDRAGPLTPDLSRKLVHLDSLLPNGDGLPRGGFVFNGEPCKRTENFVTCPDPATLQMFRDNYANTALQLGQAETWPGYLGSTSQKMRWLNSDYQTPVPLALYKIRRV